jgi:hypothetical protein
VRLRTRLAGAIPKPSPVAAVAAGAAVALLFAWVYLRPRLHRPA